MKCSVTSVYLLVVLFELTMGHRYVKRQDDAVPKNFEEIACVRGHSTRATQLHRNSACGARKVLKDLKMDAGAVFLPKAVDIDQCGGICHGNENIKCMPTVEEMVEIPVTMPQAFRFPTTMVRRSPPRNKCLVYRIKKHTACTCQCMVTEEDCDRQTQVYIPNDCRCSCKDQASKERECNDQGKMFDIQSCECKCRQRRECSSQFYFNMDTCRCEAEIERRQL